MESDIPNVGRVRWLVTHVCTDDKPHDTVVPRTDRNNITWLECYLCHSAVQLIGKWPDGQVVLPGQDGQALPRRRRVSSHP
jgi:hypothetical protein